MEKRYLNKCFSHSKTKSLKNYVCGSKKINLKVETHVNTSRIIKKQQQQKKVKRNLWLYILVIITM